jgi:hypothetical protein
MMSADSAPALRDWRLFLRSRIGSTGRISLFAVALAGVLLYFLLGAVTQSLSPHYYSPIAQAEGDLVVMPFGYIMTLNFVNRGDTAGHYGVAGKSLTRDSTPLAAMSTGRAGGSEAAEPPGEIRNIREFRQVKLRAERVIVTTASKPSRAHRALCRELPRKGSRRQ